MRCFTSILVLLLCGLPSVAASADLITHKVESEYQNGKHEILVLLPDDYRKDKLYRVLYVLPTEAKLGKVYVPGIKVFKKMDAHNRHNIIMVEMGFEKSPWYGDHATDPKVRQASYVKSFVVPFIEKRYSTLRGPEGRLLFGTSKSGWGSFSLILKYPEFFGYAAAWDAPILMKGFGWQMKAIYGTLEQLALYRPDFLIAKQKRFFQQKTRLVLTGAREKNLAGHHTKQMNATHQLLVKEGLKHHYDRSLDVKHNWNEEWMGPTLSALIALTEQGKALQEIKDISKIPSDLLCPKIVNGDPAAGKRVKDYLSEYKGTGVSHAVYLPKEWKKNNERKYPVIIEYAGNGYSEEKSVLGYGVSGGEKFIWVNMPFVNKNRKSTTMSWWGDLDTTLAYCKKAVPEICDKYGGDKKRVILAGFSRGSIACNYIGLHDDEISKLWCAFICHSHYDNRKWAGPHNDAASRLARLKRLGNRPQFVSHERGNTIKHMKTYIENNLPKGNITFQEMSFPQHSVDWVLKDIPERKNVRAWLKNVLSEKN